MVRASAKDAKVGGGGLLGVGLHHVIICEPAKVETGDYGLQVLVKIQSLASNPESETGKTRTCYLDCEGKFAGRIWEAAIACGLVTMEQFEQAQASPECGADIDETEFEGREALVEVREYFKKDKATGKETTDKAEAVNWIPWSEPRAKNFPRNPKSALMVAVAQGTPAATTNGVAQPAGAGADGDY